MENTKAAPKSAKTRKRNKPSSAQIARARRNQQTAEAVQYARRRIHPVATLGDLLIGGE